MGWGDEIMVSGRARRMFIESGGRKVLVRDRHGSIRWHDAWIGNPHIYGRNERVSTAQDLLDYPGKRPYHIKKTDQRWVFNLQFRPEVGNLYFTEAEQLAASAYDPEIVIGPTIKAKASPNKYWGTKNWMEFARIASAAGFSLTQLGDLGSTQFPGVRYVHTPSFRSACAVLARARAFVGQEGGLHHAAAALGIPGVVIFGGFTPVELTGYTMHTNIGASLGDACGMRIPCDHCVQIMESITPEQVLFELQERLKHEYRTDHP